MSNITVLVNNYQCVVLELKNFRTQPSGAFLLHKEKTFLKNHIHEFEVYAKY